MIFNVASLLTARQGATRMMAIEDGEIKTDRHRFCEINGPVQMLRTDRTVLVSASVSATVSDTCSRCLAPAKLIVTTEFEEEFEPANRDLMSDNAASVSWDLDPALLIDPRNMLDMTEALGQSLALAVPLAPVCTDNCAGFCTICFTNRNQSACNCDENPIDPRWQSLAQLGMRTSNSNN